MRSLVRAVGKARGAVVGTLAAVLLASGCGSPGPGQPGAAAIVGDTVISVEQVQDQIETVLDKEGEQVRAELVANRQLDDLSRQIVTLLVRHELIEIISQRANLSATSQEVSKQLYELGGPQIASRGTVWTEEGFREHARDQVLMMKLGRRTLETAVTFDYTTAATRTAAIRRAEELARAGPHRARELIRADVEAQRDAAVSKRVVAGDDPIFAASPAFGVAKDTVVAFQFADNQPWLIAVVKNRSTGAEPSDEAPDPDQIDPALLETIGLRQLTLVAADVGVQISPRYGVWDPLNLRVVSHQDEIGGFVEPLDATPRT